MLRIPSEGEVIGRCRSISIVLGVRLTGQMLSAWTAASVVDRRLDAPWAFVTLHEVATATADDIITFCREQLAHYKSPKTVVFGPLPKTSTGKIQKFVLSGEAENLEN